MASAEFLSKANIYEGDYSCILRNPDNEMISRLHYHDFYEFVIYLGSAGVFRIKDEEHLVQRGDIILIEMFTPHTLVNTKLNYYERFSVNIDPSLLITFSTATSNLLDVFNEAGKHYRIFHVDEESLAKYCSLLNEYRDIRDKKGQDILSKALVHHLLAYIYSDSFIDSRHTALDSNHFAIVAQMISYINENLDQDLSLKQLSQIVNYSEFYICRVFKKLTNKTLVTYIKEKRIDQAAYLLRQNIPINQVAEQVGFNSYSYFYKTFKQLKGCNPADYREQRIK